MSIASESEAQVMRPGALGSGFNEKTNCPCLLITHNGKTGACSGARCLKGSSALMGGWMAKVIVTFGRKAHPVWSLVASSVLVAVGLGMLVGTPGTAAAGIVLYGMGSGIRSIVRGTVPLAMFGREGSAILMGRLSLPILPATAAAP